MAKTSTAGPYATVRWMRSGSAPIGSLVVATHRADRSYSTAEQDALISFAEHVSKPVMPDDLLVSLPRQGDGTRLLVACLRYAEAWRSKRVFMRSMATRRQHAATNTVLKDCIARAGSLEGGLKYYVGAANLPDDGGYAAKVLGDAKICKVSIVGIGMRSHVGVASKMFRCLADEGINIQMITTSEIKTSVVIDEKYMELAVRALHKAFDLDQPSA